MKFALQRCCTTPVFLKQYESSTDAVLSKLGIEAVEIREFNCCGYPLRNFDARAHVLAAARNLALAARENLDILTFCNCCYGTLRHVTRRLEGDASLRDEIGLSLRKEGLLCDQLPRTKHLMEIVYGEIGVQGIRERRTASLEGVKVAAHCGCHILRPKETAVQLDALHAPEMLDLLVEATGAESIPWARKQDCCGAPVLGVNDELSMDLAQKKIAAAREAGADCLCTSCPYCQLQFDRVQRLLRARRAAEHHLPAMLLTQLIGLALGLDAGTLGIRENEVDTKGIAAFLSQKESGLASHPCLRPF